MTAATLELIQGGAQPNDSGLIVPPAFSLLTAEIPEPTDIDLTEAVLDGDKITAELSSAITDGTINRTIEGASTIELNVEDPRRRLIRNHVITQKFAKDEDVYLEIDGRDFALVKMSKSDDIHTLTFENRAVYEMRKVFGALKAYRDSITRAMFLLRMVRQVKGYHIQFYSPELEKVQAITNFRSSSTRSTRDKLRHSGIASDANLDIDGVRADKGQISILNRALDVAYARKGTTPYPVIVALVEAILDESRAHNLSGGDRDSAGILQQRPSQGWGTYAQVRDPERATTKFLDRAIPYYNRHPQAKASVIAQAVQASGTPSGSNYEHFKSEAVAIVRAYGSHGGSGSITLDRLKRYPFKRGRTEDSWTAAKRLADQVKWLLFCVDDTMYYISWSALLASQPRMTLSEATPGVKSIDYDIDKGKRVEQITVQARATRWSAPPGTVVMVEDMGPADDRWVVTEHSRPIYSREAEITLKRPGKSAKEPAAARTTVNLGGGTTGLKALDAAYAKAKAIQKKHYPYVYGGGHGSGFGPTGGGYDCSGSVSAVLHAAGWMKNHPMATGPLANWGHAGVGKYLTVWVRNGSKGVAHTFIEFHMPGKSLEHFGTGRWGTGTNGPSFKPQLHSKNGFSPRHWPGF